MEHSYEKHFQIRSCEMDMWRRPRVTALLNYLQDAATDHATSLGVGVAALASQNLAWVVSRYHVKLLGSASRGDMVSVHTWPATRDTYFSRRDFEVLLHGVPIAIASSTWAAVDLTSRRSVRLCDRVPEYPVVNHQAMPDRQDQLPAVKVPGTEVTFRVKVNDLDLNRHVGNAVYAGWALETVPMEIAGTCRLAELEIAYRAEALFGDTVTARSQLVDGPSPTLLHQIVNSTTGKELTRLRTRWVSDQMVPLHQPLPHCA